MRAAPPVAVSLAEPRRERHAAAALGALAAAAFMAWALGHLADLLADAARTALVLAAGLLGVLAGRSLWPRPRASRLRWDGQAWQLLDAQGAELPARVRLAVDAGFWLLLQCRQADGAVQWLGLWRDRCAGAWHPLRAALYCPAPTATAPVPPPDPTA